MERLIIHSGFRDARIPELARCDSAVFTIGRAFTNDLVLSDIHVAAELLRLFRDDGEWYVQQLEFTNPVLLNGQPLAHEPRVLRSGDSLQIGRSALTVYGEDHPVAPVRKQVLAGWLQRSNIGLLSAVLLMLLYVALSAALEYVLASTDLNSEEYLFSMLLGSAFILLWAGSWAFTGRLLKHQHRLPQQIIATLLALLVLDVLLYGGSVLVFFTHSLQLQTWLAYATAFLVLALLLQWHLKLATNLRHGARIAVMFSALLVGSAVWFGELLDDDEDHVAGSPELPTVLMPPPLPTQMTQTPAAFLDTLNRKLQTATAE